MRHAIVVFTKVPKAGETKTRLTVERGGILTAEEAQEFYQASLLDVVDSCISAGCCDMYICHNRGGDTQYLLQLLKSLPGFASIKGIFSDEGDTFDKGMQYAADYILKGGQAGRYADSVFIIGGDSPCLQAATVRDAVKKLEQLAACPQALECANACDAKAAGIGAALVESADQEGGFNLIGFTCTTPFDFNGVFYNPNGVMALDMIAYKAGEYNIPLNVVDMVIDVDLPADLASLIPIINTLKLVERFDSTVVAPKRTVRFLEDMGLVATALPPKPGAE